MQFYWLEKCQMMLSVGGKVVSVRKFYDYWGSRMEKNLSNYSNVKWINIGEIKDHVYEDIP